MTPPFHLGIYPTSSDLDQKKYRQLWLRTMEIEAKPPSMNLGLNLKSRQACIRTQKSIVRVYIEGLNWVSKQRVKKNPLVWAANEAISDFDESYSEWEEEEIRFKWAWVSLREKEHSKFRLFFGKCDREQWFRGLPRLVIGFFFEIAATLVS